MALVSNPISKLKSIWCDITPKNMAMAVFLDESLQVLKAFLPLPCGRVPVKREGIKSCLLLDRKCIAVALSCDPTSKRMAICGFVVERHTAVLVFFRKSLKMLEALFPSRSMRVPLKPKYTQLLPTLLRQGV